MRPALLALLALTLPAHAIEPISRPVPGVETPARQQRVCIVSTDGIACIRSDGARIECRHGGCWRVAGRWT